MDAPIVPAETGTDHQKSQDKQVGQCAQDVQSLSGSALRARFVVCHRLYPPGLDTVLRYQISRIRPLALERSQTDAQPVKSSYVPGVAGRAFASDVQSKRLLG